LVRLRIKDVDPSSLRYAVASLGRGTVTVRCGKGPSSLRYAVASLGRGTVTVRCGKGDPASLSYAGASKDRVTVLPRSLREDLTKQMERARELWSKDREAGLAGVWLPGVLARKFCRAAESFEWF
jgi:hypothetical protein